MMILFFLNDDLDLISTGSAFLLDEDGKISSKILFRERHLLVAEIAQTRGLLLATDEQRIHEPCFIIRNEKICVRLLADSCLALLAFARLPRLSKRKKRLIFVIAMALARSNLVFSCNELFAG